MRKKGETLALHSYEQSRHWNRNTVMTTKMNETLKHTEVTPWSVFGRLCHSGAMCAQRIIQCETSTSGSKCEPSEVVNPLAGQAGKVNEWNLEAHRSYAMECFWKTLSLRSNVCTAYHPMWDQHVRFKMWTKRSREPSKISLHLQIGPVNNDHVEASKVALLRGTKRERLHAVWQLLYTWSFVCKRPREFRFFP